MKIFGLRILACILDILFILVLCFPFWLLAVYIESIDFKQEELLIDSVNLLTYSNIVIYCGFIIFLNKDIFNGRSVAKNLLGMEIISFRDDKPASKLQTLIKNIFIIFFPIEIIVMFLNPQRRLGDYIAGTKIILCKRVNFKKILCCITKSSIKELIINTIISIGITILLFFIMQIEG